MIDTNIHSLDLIQMTEDTQNVYKSVVVVGRRANQISAHVKAELNEKLADFQTSGDNLDEVVENREQIELAKYYEALPKPTLLAIDEYLNHKVLFRDANAL